MGDLRPEVIPVIIWAIGTNRESVTQHLNNVQGEREINPLTPNDPYSGRTAPLTSTVAFYIFIQRI